MQKELRFYGLLITPTMLTVLLVIGFPILFSLYLSFHRINVLTKQWIFVGIDNYLRIIPDNDFLFALMRTSYFTIFTVFLQLVIGFIIALILNKHFLGRN